MTIVMIGQKGLPARSGGVERHVAALATGLASLGHRVIVYGRPWYVKGEHGIAGVEVRLTRGLKLKYLDAITHDLTALWEARRLKPTIIHLHGSGTALLTPLARLFHPQAKIVVTLHCEDWKLTKWRGFGWVFKLGEWLAFHFAHRTLTVSQELVRYCLNAYGYQPQYIPHPFPLPTIQPATQFVERFGLLAGKYFLFVGRLIPDKQAHLLLEAFNRARLEEPEAFQDFKLVIVGGGKRTDQYVNQLCQQSIALEQVKLLGERYGDELAALQAQAFAHVFPTASEGLSIAILEAAAFRRPIIVTALSQNQEATGGHGIEVRPNDLRDLVRGLKTMIQLSDGERIIMGEALYQHVAQAFAFEQRVAEVDSVYSELSQIKTTVFGMSRI